MYSFNNKHIQNLYNSSGCIGCLIALILFPLVLFGSLSLGAYILMLPYNYLAIYFGFKTITFWVAFCIIALLVIVSSYFKNYKS